MQRFFIIGTAHLDNPDLSRALECALDDVRPDQLILEMPDDVVATGEVERQKPDMLVAFRWAKRHGVPVRGHEPSAPSILRSDLTPERMGSLVQEMDALILGLTVRKTIDIFCRRGALETAAEERLSAIINELIDPEKALTRTRAIIVAIRQVAAPDGAVMIICGGAHVAHVSAALPDCQIIHGEHFF